MTVQPNWHLAMAPCDVHYEAIIMKALKQLSLLDLVFFLIPAGYQDVIYVHEDEIQSLTNCVHKALETLGEILEPKWHSEELIKSERGYDGSFGHILLRDWDLMIAPYYVDF